MSPTISRRGQHDEAAVAAVFLSGRPFPVWEETTLQVGGALLWRTVAEFVRAKRGRTDGGLPQAWRFGSGRAESASCARDASRFSVLDVQESSAGSPPRGGLAPKSALVSELLSTVTPLEAKYVVKIMTGDLRIGLKESLVEEAIAKAFGER